MCCATGPTGGQFNKIDQGLQKHDVTWGNCAGFLVDNTSASLGKQNPIKTRVLEKNQECYFLGCPCHIMHNTVHKAGVILEIEGSVWQRYKRALFPYKKL